MTQRSRILEELAHVTVLYCRNHFGGAVGAAKNSMFCRSRCEMRCRARLCSFRRCWQAKSTGSTAQLGEEGGPVSAESESVGHGEFRFFPTVEIDDDGHRLAAVQEEGRLSFSHGRSKIMM